MNCCTFLASSAKKEGNIWKFQLTNLRRKTVGFFWCCMFSLEHLQLLTQGSFCLHGGNINNSTDVLVD